MMNSESGIKYQENSWILRASNDQRIKVKYRVDEEEEFDDNEDCARNYLRIRWNRWSSFFEHWDSKRTFYPFWYIFRYMSTYLIFILPLNDTDESRRFFFILVLFEKILWVTFLSFISYVWKFLIYCAIFSQSDSKTNNFTLSKNEYI